MERFPTPPAALERAPRPGDRETRLRPVPVRGDGRPCRASDAGVAPVEKEGLLDG